MAWTKSPEALIALFDRTIPADPTIERRKMFGYPAAFANGNMFAGLFQDMFVLRLAEVDRADLIGQGGTVFEPMAGRPMRGYVALPKALLSDEAALSGWIDRSLAHASALAPKAKKAARRRTARP